jgi:quercetin dioxygenase-like cupin family protein
MNRKKKTVRLAAALVAAAAAGATALWAASAPDDDALDPIKVAGDTHALVLDNAFVRVLDVHVPPGKTEPRHRHPHGLSVYFTDWTVKATVDGKAAETHERKAGTFAWQEAQIHSVENVGKTEGHILRIELKY